MKKKDINNNSVLAKCSPTVSEKTDFNEEFCQWFSGFSDAESCFLIQPVLNSNKNKVSRFSFKFIIELHKDDLGVLELIKKKLGIGNIRLIKDTCVYMVSDKKGIYTLINIFDKYNLNTTKYLDYFNFKKAFILYFERRDPNLKVIEAEELKNQILEIKNCMNTKRSDFNMDNHQVIITKNWLLGFLEGDGSFYLSRTKMVPTFSIELSEIQFSLILKIKEFLINNLNFDKYSIHKLRLSEIISINKLKGRLGKPSVTLVIQNINILNNYLIPYLEDMKWNSKKGLDFPDFKIICRAIYHGAHRDDYIKSLIIKLSYTMNNYRLSTNLRESSTASLELKKSEINQIINAKPTIEHLSDGRIRDIVTKKIVPYNASCIYEIIKPTGEILIVEYLDEVLQIVGVGFRTLKRRLDDQDKIEPKCNDHIVKRIPVFYPKDRR